MFSARPRSSHRNIQTASVRRRKAIGQSLSEPLEQRVLLSASLPANPVPTAELLSPVAGGLFSAAQLNRRHALEIQISTPDGSAINAKSVLDKAQEFALSGVAASKVRVDGSPRQDPSDPSAYIYHFTGSFGVGEVAVNFLAGSFANVAGNVNIASTEQFVAATNILHGLATENGRKTPVSISRTDGGLIDPNATTWLLIHGRGGSPAVMSPIANALAPRNEQILTVNWSAGASYKNLYTDFTGQDWIKPVAVWSAEQLRSYGFTPSELNIIGHSWGADVGDELAGRLLQDGLGKVQSIVALDAARGVPPTVKLPATELLPLFGLPSLPITITVKGGKTYDQDNPGEIDFAAHANVSWAFRLSALGSAVSPSTAAEAFAVNFPASSNPITEHGDAIQFFASLLLDNNPVTAYFSPGRLLGTVRGPDDWIPNQYADTLSPLDQLFPPVASGDGYEVEIPVSFDSTGAVHAAELKYISVKNDAEVDVFPTTA